ncbi:hypothetical protein Gotri_025742 [Gossypium trilobum]|uniref:Uncharacterized protein n=1 Tax=Gossypium trilobum TaxID=34281 RepID=A0A7J9FSM0_9ROSI|nr:hypothetical protein [Gossypium trilobum]
MHPLEKSVGFNLGTSRYEKKSRSFFLEYLWVSYFWKVEKVSYRMFSEDYSSFKEFVAILRQDNISEENIG